MKFGLTIAALALSVSVFANEPNNESQKWNGSINKEQLSKYLKLSSTQHKEVSAICDYFETQMDIANKAKENNNDQVRKAVYSNLKLMKNTLDDKQYSDYEKLMSMTLRNKGIDIEKK